MRQILQSMFAQNIFEGQCEDRKTQCQIALQNLPRKCAHRCWNLTVHTNAAITKDFVHRNQYCNC